MKSFRLEDGSVASVTKRCQGGETVCALERIGSGSARLIRYRGRLSREQAQQCPLSSASLVGRSGRQQQQQPYYSHLYYELLKPCLKVKWKMCRILLNSCTRNWHSWHVNFRRHLVLDVRYSLLCIMNSWYKLYSGTSLNGHSL